MEAVKGELMSEMSLGRAALSTLQPIEGGTLGGRVYNQLRDFLMVGGVQPGEKITLRELTSAFGTSLMPVPSRCSGLQPKVRWRSSPIARSGPADDQGSRPGNSQGPISA